MERDYSALDDGPMMTAWKVYALGGVLVGVALVTPWVVRWSGVLRGPVPDVEARATRAVRPELVELPGGKFVMGSPEGEGLDHERPQHPVTISPFAICRTEVTQSQYVAVMGEDAWNCGDSCGPDKPIHSITWLEAIGYLNALTDLENTIRGKNDRLSRCYEREGEAVTRVPGCTGYRLPTEAEWEYAARARSTGPFGFEGGEQELGRYAWFAGNSGDEAHDVGGKAPNAWFLHDMHGNIWEWVWDWYDEGEYARRAGAGPVTDPWGPETGTERVLRGGSFVGVARVLRSADRLRDGPSLRNGIYGFRCVRGGAQHRP